MPLAYGVRRIRSSFHPVAAFFAASEAEIQVRPDAAEFHADRASVVTPLVSPQLYSGFPAKAVGVEGRAAALERAKAGRGGQRAGVGRERPRATRSNARPCKGRPHHGGRRTGRTRPDPPHRCSARIRRRDTRGHRRPPRHVEHHQTGQPPLWG